MPEPAPKAGPEPPLSDLVYERVAAEDLPDDEVATLERVPALLLGPRANELSDETRAALQAAAAVGYAARLVEAERLPAAGPPTALAPMARSSNGDTDRAVAAVGFAVEEPIDPSPDNGFKPSWLVPGLDPDGRGRLREDTLTIVVRPGEEGRLVVPGGEISDAELVDFRRAWKCGYFLACLRELTA